MTLTEIQLQLNTLFDMMEEYALEKADTDLDFPENYNSDIKQAIKGFVKEELGYLEGRAKAYKQSKI